MTLTLQKATTDPCFCWDSWTLTGKSGSVSCGLTAPFPWVLVHKVLLCPPRVYFPVLCKFWQLYGGANGNLLQEAYATPRSAAPRVPVPASIHCWPVPPQEMLRVLSQSLWDSWVLECIRFVWVLWESLLGIEFDSKREFAPPTILLGLFLCPSVQSLSRVWLFAIPWIAALQASCPSPTPGVYSNSCPSSRWCRPAISSSVVPFSSCPQSLPASGSFAMGQLFAWGGQSIGVSGSASVPPMNTQEWSPCSPRDSQESSPTPQYRSINFSALSFLHSPTLTHTWPLEKP